MELAGVAIVVAGVLALIVLSMVWHFGRSSELLEGWAEREGYRLVASEYRTFFKGPFFWTATKGQTVYYVTVEDRTGLRRNAWVQCGGFWWGLLSDDVQVVWD